VIVDTGSTDGTQDIIREFMEDVPGELHERPWLNFAHNRNEAMWLAKLKGDYLLFIDADEVLKFSDHFVCPYLDKDSYYIMTRLAGTEYVRLQLINNHLNWRWIGVLHEYVYSAAARTSEVLAGVYNFPSPDGFRSQDSLKFKKDAAVLEEALKTEPYNDRYVFYLAQSYKDAGELELALQNYKKRVEMGGWDQEVYISKYQIALLQEDLNMEPEQIIKGYLDCFSSRPIRAEPLFRLARYYRSQGEFLLGYLVADHALKITNPTDTLFVEKWIYEYGLLLEKSIDAYWIGNFKESLELCQQILELSDLPDNVRECVEKNLWWATQQIPTAVHTDIPQ